jgi:hypothetical protein
MDYRYDKDGNLIEAVSQPGPLGELASAFSEKFAGIKTAIQNEFSGANEPAGGYYQKKRGDPDYNWYLDSLNNGYKSKVGGPTQEAQNDANLRRWQQGPRESEPLPKIMEDLARTKRLTTRASQGLGPVPYEPVVPPVVPNALQPTGQVSIGNDAALKDADALKLTLDQLSKSGKPAASVVESVVRRLGGSGSVQDFYENIAQRAKDGMSRVSEKGVTQDTSGALGQIAQTYGAISPDPRWKDYQSDPSQKPWEQVGPVEQARALKANAVIDAVPGATKFQKTMNYLNDEGLGFTAQWAAAELLKGNYQPPEWSEKPAPTTELIQEFLKAGGTLVMAGDSPEAVRNRGLLQNLAHGIEDERAKVRAAERTKGGASKAPVAPASSQSRPLFAVNAAKAEAQSNLTFTQQEQQLKLKQRQADIDETLLRSQGLGIKVQADLQDLMDKPRRTAAENAELDLKLKTHNLQVAKFAQQTLQDQAQVENWRETQRLAQERLDLEAGKGPAGVEAAAKKEALTLSMFWEKSLAASEKAVSEAESMKAPVPPNEAAKAAARELGLDPSKPEELAKLALPSTWEKHLKGKTAGAAPAASQPAAQPAVSGEVNPGVYLPFDHTTKFVEGQHYFIPGSRFAFTIINGKPVQDKDVTLTPAKEKKSE